MNAHPKNLALWGAAAFGLISLAAACGTSLGAEPGGADLGATDELATGPVGAVPGGFTKLQIGLLETKGKTWMQSSGVPWSARYMYFTKGWVNNWGYGTYDGSWGLAYFRECANAGFVPAIAYYQMNEEAGGGESAFYAKTKNATTMRGYFGDFKILMQRAKDFGKPVYILLEADGFAEMEQQTAENPNAYAAVAATGLPELQGLPNTAAGWGMAFLQLRKAVGASNAILGIHISGWASGKDLFNYSVTDSLQPEVDKVYNFLSRLGLAANQTGQTYDVLVGDPLDRDADYYRLQYGNPNMWWSTSDSASISSKSFNRYAEWLRLWNIKAQKRWVLWQVPEGNSNSPNVYNQDNGSRGGYKDNRPEYFFNGGTTHLQKFVNAGVVAILFGRGAGGQTTHMSDFYTDGQLFLKTRAGSFLRNGSLGLGGGTVTPPDGGTIDGGSPPPATDGGTPPPATDGGTTPSDRSIYSFESGSQGWSTSVPALAVSSSTARAYAGTHSLAVKFSNTSSIMEDVFVSTPSLRAGANVTFHVYVPTGSTITTIQPYVLQGSGGGWAWTGKTLSTSGLAGTWATITLQVPTNAVTPLYQLGVEFGTSGAYSGTAYIDAVTW